MNIVQAFILGALVIVFGFSAYSNNEHQKQRIGELSKINESYESVLSEMVQSQVKAREQTVRLLSTQEGIRVELAHRENEMRRLQTDVQEIKDWADTALPLDIKWLRQRPALTGASAYSKWLPTSDSMHFEPEQSTE